MFSFQKRFYWRYSSRSILFIFFFSILFFPVHEFKSSTLYPNDKTASVRQINSRSPLFATISSNVRYDSVRLPLKALWIRIIFIRVVEERFYFWVPTDWFYQFFTEIIVKTFNQVFFWVPIGKGFLIWKNFIFCVCLINDVIPMLDTCLPPFVNFGLCMFFLSHLCLARQVFFDHQSLFFF